jgi:predicted ATP-binding protein involved in virulence
MRITQISVTKLFGIFDHIIPLKLDDRITIIHGPNGFGKTAILRMLNGLLNGQYHDLRNTPFEEFRIQFDKPKHSLRVTRSLSERRERRSRGSHFELTIHYSKNGKNPQTYVPGYPPDQREFHFPTSIIDQEIPELARIAPRVWRSLPSGEDLTLDEVLERYSDRLSLRYDMPKREPEWLKEIREHVSVKFIETQRLLTMKSSKRSPDFHERFPVVPSVAEYSNELSQSIQAKLAESAALSQSLDRTFPLRVMSHQAPSHVTSEQLRDELGRLEEKRAHLMEAGLIDSQGDLEFHVPPQIDESTRNLLSVYVKDVEEKLGVFDDIVARIDLLKKIINSRFLFKKMAISRSKGFTITTTDGKSIEPSVLSSGEQHELVLLYELLFKVKRGSLILIDEPELSLHVNWQDAFLRDLKEIADLSDLDVILATHSPQIISDRWDLQVELQEPRAS